MIFDNSFLNSNIRTYIINIILDKKQLAWEQDRHRWIHGKNKDKKKKNKFNFEKNNQGKKRQHNKQSGNKKKKQKR